MFFGDPGQARELARLVNEEIAGITRAQPHKFGGLAMLPLPDVDAALEELTYVLDVLSLDGVILLSHVAGTYLGDPSWDRLFAELDRRGAYAFVHPTIPPNGVPLGHPAWLYEFPFETTRAMANLIYSGTFERYPNIRMQFAHLGGAAPFLAGRIASLADREAHQAENAPAGALEYLSRQYYDTGLANNEIAVSTVLQVAPLDHVVFGTDWPYLALPDEPGDPAPELNYLNGARDALEARNVAALVPRLVR